MFESSRSSNSLPIGNSFNVLQFLLPSAQLPESTGEIIIRNILKKEARYNNAKKRKVVEEVVSPRESEFDIKSKSHEELEIEIQSKRILLVLDEAIFKLHVASCLGVLIEDEGKLLRKYFPQEDVEFILDACAKYVDSDVFDYENVTSSGGKQHFALPRDNRVDVNVAQSIEMISKCQELQQSIGLLSPSENNLAEKFLEGIHRLRMAVARKLSVTASEERKREKELRIAWKENSEAKVIIASIQQKLDKQTEELQVQLDAKNDLIEAYKTKIDNITEQFQSNIKRRVTESEKTMVHGSQLSEECQTALAQEVKERAQEYQVLVESHIASEKILRAKRLKVEAQLASWIAKYDQDMGERQTELEELTKLYEEEMEEMNNLQVKFDEQEEEYTVLMAERDEYEAAIDNQKAFEFLCNRAARIIQRCWKAFRERKKKKGKKGKKKKKSGGSRGGSAKSRGGSAKSRGGSAKSRGGSQKGKGKSKIRQTEDIEDFLKEDIPA